jgi:hypothetical protein
VSSGSLPMVMPNQRSEPSKIFAVSSGTIDPSETE